MSRAACKQCGGRPDGDVDCKDLYDRLVERRFSVDAPLYRLGIACYILQHRADHPEHSQAWAWAFLRAAVADNWTAEELRARSDELNERARTQEPPPAPESWAVTVADAFEGAERDLPERILAWAQSTLAALGG